MVALGEAPSMLLQQLRTWFFIGGQFATLSLTAVGCQMFDVLHPNQTWKLNRGPALDEGDAYFSVSDPLPETP